MNRYVAALLVVLGVVGLLGVLAVGRGFANDEKAARAKCSEATLKGTYLFAQNGVEIKAMTRGLSPSQAMMSLTATVRSKASLQVTLMGRHFVTSPALERIASRRIAQAPSPLRMARVTICSSPLMALSLRSCVPTPRLCRRVLNCGECQASRRVNRKSTKDRGYDAPAFLLVALIHRSAWKRNSANFAMTEFSEIQIQDPA